MPGRFVELRSRLAFASMAIALSGLAADPSGAQAPGAMSLNDFVLAWMQGNYATPLYCKIDGESQRGLRRILIGAGSKKSLPRDGVVRFVDLEAESATRCFTEIGGSSPNITGELVVRHPTIKIRDTAMRDFKSELRRMRGFELDIISGELLVSEIGTDSTPAESLEFRGGKMRVHVLRPGSDGMRLLQSLPSPRKVKLEFETRTGRIFSFPASLAKPREIGASTDSP